MQRLFRRLSKGLLFAGCFAEAVLAQQTAQKTMTWQQAREEFEKSNPTLRAARLGIDESRDEEITAYLRPNPDFTVSLDQINPFTDNPVNKYSPFSEALPYFSSSYLHERRHKRELRLESAQKATAIAQAQLADQERTLLFTLRGAFVQALQAKAVRDMAKDNLAYFDHELGISQDRYKAGDIARVDLDRQDLLRVTYESDLQTAEVNLRTAKIQLLQLLKMCIRDRPCTASKMLSSSERAVRGSKTTGTFCVSTLRAPSRRRARCAAMRPTSSGFSSPANPRAVVNQ